MSSFAEDLAGLPSAEDFFAYFAIPYDPQIVAASRLHILKRFHDYLGEIDDLEALADPKPVYRAQLLRAYGDYAGASPAARHIFPGLLRASRSFVALSSLKRTGA